MPCGDMHRAARALACSVSAKRHWDGSSGNTGGEVVLQVRNAVFPLFPDLIGKHRAAHSILPFGKERVALVWPIAKQIFLSLFT